MKDIQLTQTSTGFDWNFQENDVITATGNSQIKSGIIHEILLRRGELEQEVYAERGSTLYEYAYVPHTERMNTMIEHIVIDACTHVDGVRDAQATVENSENGIVIKEINITKTDGGMIRLAIQK